MNSISPVSVATPQETRLPAREPSEDGNIQRRLEQHLAESVHYQVILKTFGKDGEVKGQVSSVQAQLDLTYESLSVRARGQGSGAVSVTRLDAQLSVDSFRWQQSGAGSGSVSLESFRAEFSLTIESGEVEQADPLMLDLDGRGIQTTGVPDGVQFDLTADGQLTLTSVNAPGTGFLALDRNGNGVIDDGSELFGDQNGAVHGFAELARYDSNGDGVIDQADAIFEDLRILTFDADGRQQLTSLTDQGIRALYLDYRDVDIALNTYDRIAQFGRFEWEDGRSGDMADVLLGYQGVS